MRSLFVAFLLFATGCDLYFSDDDDDCLYATGAAEIAPNELRDPETGECQPFDYPYPCDPVCGPCPGGAELSIAQPDWGSCFSQCEALDEVSCAATAGCRIAYDDNPAIADEPLAFKGCWAIAPSGPATGEACAGLDAYGCSRHDDCSAVYQLPGPNADGISKFVSCIAEQVGASCTGDEQCGPGMHCTTSDGECLPCPDGQGACPAVCFGTCVMDYAGCAAVDCAPGSHCEEHCTVPPNGPVTCETTCVPDQMACGPSTCPPNTQCVQVCSDDPNNPGCGVCTVECVPIGTCESLTTEATCSGRSDCQPIYQGENCTCYQDGTCECQILTYDHCEKK